MQMSAGYDAERELGVEALFRVTDLCGERDSKAWLIARHPELTEKITNEMSSAALNRLIKFSDLKDGEKRVYLDRSIDITDRASFRNDLKGWLADSADIIQCRHPFRHTMLEEVAICYRLSKISKSDYFKIKERILVDPCIRPLTQNGFYLALNSKKVNPLFRRIREELVDFSWRDQLVVPMLVEESGISVKYIDWPSYMSVRSHRLNFSAKALKKIRFMTRKYCV